LIVVLVVLALNAGCSATREFGDRAAVPTPSLARPTESATEQEPDATPPNTLPPDDTPPPPRPLERRVIKSLAAIGVDGGVAQHGFRDAMIAGDWRDRTILIHAYPTDYQAAATPGEILGHATVSQAWVAFLFTRAFGTIGRFHCNGLVYDVSSQLPDLEGGSNRRDVTRFLRTYVPTLDC